MRQIWITQPGEPEVLTVREAEDPKPQAGEALVDVKASGVNFADVMARMGMYPDAPPLPTVVGYEIAGVVRSVGMGVVEVEPGQSVVGITRFGGYSDVVAVPVPQLFPIPPGIGFSEAAAIPVNYMTAALALYRFGNVQPGERVLVHNAGGGVGIAAAQLAKARGATVFGTSSAWKHDRLREIGVEHPIDYRDKDFVAEVQALTNGAGVHVILDPIGGSNLTRDMKVLAPLGRLVAYGLSASVKNGKRSKLSLLLSALRMPRPSFLSLLGKNHSVAGLNIGHLWSEIDRLRPVMQEIQHAIDAGFVMPIVEAEVPFDRAAEAHRLLQERKNFGKVVLVP